MIIIWLYHINVLPLRCQTIRTTIKINGASDYEIEAATKKNINFYYDRRKIKKHIR